MKDASHPLQCRCGTIKGHVVDLQYAQRLVCYCKDCQAFAHFLGRGADILDHNGGTEVIQTLPRNVVFTSGLNALACMRLTEKGLLRWYAGCCRTPIGNTVANYKVSFIGLIHNCLDDAGRSLDDSFGPVAARVNTKSASGNPSPKPQGTLPAIVRIVRNLLKARLDGSYQHTPFFDHGVPVARPKVLTQSELTALKRAL